MSDEKRFKEFIKELEIISNKYKIAVKSIGGVEYLEENENIKYSKDFTSGDVEYKVK